VGMSLGAGVRVSAVTKLWQHVKITGEMQTDRRLLSATSVESPSAMHSLDRFSAADTGLTHDDIVDGKSLLTVTGDVCFVTAAVADDFSFCARE